MTKKGNRNIDGYFDFVVPPLEGFWWQEPAGGEIDYANKEGFRFISCIRLPDFVTPEVFDWAVAEATAKKKLDFSAVEFLKVNEGLCVQCMHTGSYDNEPATIDAMHEFAAKQRLRTGLFRAPFASRNLPVRPTKMRFRETKNSSAAPYQSGRIVPRENHPDSTAVVMFDGNCTYLSSNPNRQALKSASL